MKNRTLEDELRKRNKDLVSVDAREVSVAHLALTQDSILSNYELYQSVQGNEKRQLKCEEISDILNEMEKFRVNYSKVKDISKTKDEYGLLALQLAEMIKGFDDPTVKSLYGYILEIIESNKEIIRYDYMKDVKFKTSHPEFFDATNNLSIRILGDNFAGLRIKHHIINALKYLHSVDKKKEEVVKIYENIIPVNNGPIDYGNKPIDTLGSLLTDFKHTSDNSFQGTLKHANDMEDIFELVNLSKYSGIDIEINPELMKELGLKPDTKYLTSETGTLNKIPSVDTSNFEWTQNLVDAKIIYQKPAFVVFARAKLDKIILRYELGGKSDNETNLDNPSDHTEYKSEKLYSVMETLAYFEFTLNAKESLKFGIGNNHCFGREFLDQIYRKIPEIYPHLNSRKYKDAINESVAIYVQESFDSYDKLSALICYKEDRYAISVISNRKNLNISLLIDSLSRGNSINDKIIDLVKNTDPEYMHFSYFKGNEKCSDLVLERKLDLDKL